MRPCTDIPETMKQKIFRWREARAPLLSLLALVAGVMAISAQSRAADLSGSAAFTSDYVWRGSTQTRDDPAMQVGVKLAGTSGLYASLWGSNVRFAPGSDASSELDFSLGWGRSIGSDYSLDLNLLRYHYPSTVADLDWTEANASLTYQNRYWLALGHSRRALGYDAAGTYAQIGGKWPLHESLRLEASAARYFLDADAVGRNGYNHAQLSGVWAFKAPFELRLSAHASDGDADALFGHEAAGTRVEAALQAAF